MGISGGGACPPFFVPLPYAPVHGVIYQDCSADCREEITNDKLDNNEKQVSFDSYKLTVRNIA